MTDDAHAPAQVSAATATAATTATEDVLDFDIAPLSADWLARCASEAATSASKRRVTYRERTKAGPLCLNTDERAVAEHDNRPKMPSRRSRRPSTWD